MCHAFMVFGISKDIYGDGEESSHDCSSSRPSQNSVDAGTLGLNSANRTLRAFSTHATPACRDITLGAHAELRLLRRPIELGFRFRWWCPHVYRTAWSRDTSSGDIEYLRIKQSDEHQPYSRKFLRGAYARAEVAGLDRNDGEHPPASSDCGKHCP